MSIAADGHRGEIDRREPKGAVSAAKTAVIGDIRKTLENFTVRCLLFFRRNNRLFAGLGQSHFHNRLRGNLNTLPSSWIPSLPRFAFLLYQLPNPRDGEFPNLLGLAHGEIS